MLKDRLTLAKINLQRKLLTFALLFLAFIISTRAQSIPQSGAFAGTWVIDSKKNWLGPPAQADSKIPNFADEIIWSIDGDKIRILKRFISNTRVAEDLTLYADGRGETNIIFAEEKTAPATVKSETKWDKATLIRKYEVITNSEIDPPGGQISGSPRRQITERYSLSKDASRLIVELREGFRFRFTFIRKS